MANSANLPMEVISCVKTTELTTGIRQRSANLFSLIVTATMDKGATSSTLSKSV